MSGVCDFRQCLPFPSRDGDLAHPAVSGTAELFDRLIQQQWCLRGLCVCVSGQESIDVCTAS
jgi:hypothetical protein